MDRLTNRLAVVTGSGGIGAATAVRLAREGAEVIIGDLNDTTAAPVVEQIRASGGRASYQQVDIADEESIVAFFAAVETRFGRLDILHNNAANTRHEQMSKDMGIEAMPAEIWDAAFHVNTRGTMLMIKHAIPLMRKAGGGSIINTSSGAALRGDLYGPAYAASKAAINCLTLYVATQYGKERIRCNVISPGLVVTPNVYVSNTQEQLDRIEIHKLTPYLGEPEDIAAAVAYLASDDAKFVTAQIMVVDGGILDHMPYVAQVRENFSADPSNRTV